MTPSPSRSRKGNKSVDQYFKQRVTDEEIVLCIMVGQPSKYVKFTVTVSGSRLDQFVVNKHVRPTLWKVRPLDEWEDARLSQIFRALADSKNPEHMALVSKLATAVEEAFKFQASQEWREPTPRRLRKPALLMNTQFFEDDKTKKDAEARKAKRAERKKADEEKAEADEKEAEKVKKKTEKDAQKAAKEKELKETSAKTATEDAMKAAKKKGAKDTSAKATTNDAPDVLNKPTRTEKRSAKEAFSKEALATFEEELGGYISPQSTTKRLSYETGNESSSDESSSQK